ATALAAHEVAASLRSSRVRLLEHLRGTAAVLHERPELAEAKVPPKRGVLDALKDIAGHPPLSRLSIPLPDWLSEAGAHRRACEEEQATYEEIERLLRGLSDARERAKATLLLELVQTRGLVLAFDGYLITLADLRLRLKEAAPQ